MKNLLPEINTNIGAAALAWTQFLIVVTVIPPGDRMRLTEITSYLDNHTHIYNWDKGVFGSLCILFNVISLCFMAIPIAGRYELCGDDGWESNPLSKQDTLRLVLHLGFFGPVFGVASFLSLLMYLDPIYAYVALGVLAATFGYAIAYMLVVMAWRAIQRLR